MARRDVKESTLDRRRLFAACQRLRAHRGAGTVNVFSVAPIELDSHAKRSVSVGEQCFNGSRTKDAMNDTAPDFKLTLAYKLESRDVARNPGSLSCAWSLASTVARDSSPETWTHTVLV